MLLLFSSCSGKKKELGAAITERDSLPVMDTRGVESLVSDSGVISYRLSAEEWLVYDKKTPSYWSFEKGVYVEKFDSLFHEIGHWLHFQNIPPLKQCREIWQKVNREKIKTDVSEYALKKDDGREFVAEVFKGLIKGKKYDEYIMQLYKKLNGPNVKTNITQNI